MMIVIGCGRVGLPLALALARSGHRVIGVESDPGREAALSAGRMPFHDEGADPVLKDVAGRAFTVTGDLEAALAVAQTVMIAIGTSLDDSFRPAMEPVVELAAALRLAPRRPLGLVVRSTLAPGTSDRLVALLESRLGLRLGEDLRYAYCPDRCAGGAFFQEMREVPQIVGAFEQRSAVWAAELFASLGAPCIVTRPLEAELAKLFNNVYRYVNFALANECLLLAEGAGADPHEAIRVARNGYPRGGPWDPGYAAGPCLFKDGFFLQGDRPTPDLFLMAWRINEHLPDHLIRRAEAIRPLRGAAVLGAGYKTGSDDTRFSPALALIRLLEARGIPVAVHDPAGRWPGAKPSAAEALAGAHEVFVAVPEPAYRRIPWAQLAGWVTPGALLVDPWNLWGQGRPVQPITEAG